MFSHESWWSSSKNITFGPSGASNLEFGSSTTCQTQIFLHSTMKFWHQKFIVECKKICAQPLLELPRSKLESSTHPKCNFFAFNCELSFLKVCNQVQTKIRLTLLGLLSSKLESSMKNRGQKNCVRPLYKLSSSKFKSSHICQMQFLCARSPTFNI